MTLEAGFLATLTVDQKTEAIIKCGECLKLPYDKRPNVEGAEQTRRRYRL